MSIYVFDMLIGYAANGIDNALGFRAKLMKSCNIPVKFFFTDVPKDHYINRYLQAGIDSEQMASLHQYMSGDIQGLRSYVKIADKLNELQNILNYTRIKEEPEQIILYKDEYQVATLNRDVFFKDYCTFASFLEHAKLIRTERYVGDKVFYSESYKTVRNDNGMAAQITKRTFYDTDGNIAYEQLLGTDEVFYIFPDGNRMTKAEFLDAAIQKLNLSSQDTVILDRPGYFEYTESIFKRKNGAKLITVLHSGHYFEKGEDTNFLYLCYEYYYWFKYSKYIDWMVVSTEEQKNELQNTLTQYGCHIPSIAVIPAGGLTKLRVPSVFRKPYSILTVSRIDTRKKIEWIIEAVAIAHRTVPNIYLDIYGKCVDAQYMHELEAIVEKHSAQDYIHFMGYQDVTEVYQNYELYLTASLWETLGLSVMEAVGSGDAVVGLDVKYGNRLFIQHGTNGYLTDFDASASLEHPEIIIEQMAGKIIECFSNSERLESFHQASYRIAQDYLMQNIADKWCKLLL